MLSGDDEIDALLAEMGGEATPTSTNDRSSTNKSAFAADTFITSDPRLTEDPTRVAWLKSLRLKESLGIHQEEEDSCRGWKHLDKGEADECSRCGKSRAFHRLVTSKSHRNQLLSLLFCHARNIRCIASEIMASATTADSLACHNRLQEYGKNITNLLSNRGYREQVTPTDLTSLQEKAKELCQFLAAALPQRTDTSSREYLEWRLSVMMKSDTLYYRIYYASLTSMSNALTDGDGGGGIQVPHPPTYFSSPGLAWNVSKKETEQFCKELDEPCSLLLTQTLGLLDTETVGNQQNRRNHNPLFILWQHRFYETARHFWKNPSFSRHWTQQALQNKISMRPNHMHEQFAQHETLATSVLQEWRDVARDFPASLYAYATPTPCVLNELSKLVLGDDNGKKPKRTIVEMGAGTGYWAALLKDRGIPVVAYDRNPPGTYSDNEYHSEVPAFTPVEQLDSNRSSSMSPEDSSSVLMLCYPPPGTDMAFDALQGFSGDSVVHVGEWNGLTGNGAFEQLLLRTFVCQTYIPLPLWGTDAAYVTIWKRATDDDSGGGREATQRNIATGGCIGCSTEPAIRRCRFARLLQYCSEGCFEKHESSRASFLAIHMLRVDQNDGKDVRWDDPHHFMELKYSSSADLDNFKEKGHKNRKKKKRRRKK